MKFRRLAAITLAVAMTAAMTTGCSKKEDPAVDTTSADPSKPNWIADRHIVVRTFNDDLTNGPSDIKGNPISAKIKELTGVTYEVQYTSGAGSLEQLTTAFASGNMPDMIIYYLNNSARKEFPVVLKGAKEGVLADLAPMLKETKIYSKYYDESYMPTDSYKNIVAREDLNGGTFHVPMRVEREIDSNNEKLRGGLYIQKSIVDALKIKPWEITNTEQFYELLKKIKDGGFKDTYGKDIVPLGPGYWGGGSDIPQNVVFNMSFGWQSNSFAYLDGTLKHEIETDYTMKQIEFLRKLIDEGLMHKEALTMEDTRAQEGAHSYSWGIINSVHSRSDVHKDYQYLPFELNNIDNKYVEMTKGKSQYGAWSIPKTTKNPEQVVKFADFMASKEGKSLWKYGIEGEHYTVKDGKYYPTDELMNKLREGDRKFFQDLNINANGGSEWGRVFGETDMDNIADFGEMIYGTNADPTIDKIPMDLYDYGKAERPYEGSVVMEGFNPLSYLDTFEKGEDLRPLLEADNFNDIRVKAVYAKTAAEAKSIIDDYLSQMNKSGLQEFKTHLDDIRKADPKMLFIEEYDVKG